MLDEGPSPNIYVLESISYEQSKGGEMSNQNPPFWQQIKKQPVFVAFDNNKNPYGVDDRAGVSIEDAPTRRGNYEQIEQLGREFIGIGLTLPIPVGNKFLVCLDFDWKRSPNKQPHTIQTIYMDKLLNEGHAFERSHSGYGCHFWVLMDRENIPLSYKITSTHEIEVFSGFNTPRKNVLVTNYEVSGQLKVLPYLDFPQHEQIKKTGAVKEPSLIPLSQIREMLNTQDPDMSEPDWWKMGGIIHLETEGSPEGFDIFNEWSEKGTKYKGEAECWDKWNRYNDEYPDAAAIGTLISIAKKEGYQPTQEVISYEKKHSLLAKAAVSKTTRLEATQWVVDGIIPNGVGVIAGVGGIGKTTAILPLSAVVAGFDCKQSEVTSKIHRHVVYITEDPIQAKNTIYGIKKHRKSSQDVSLLEDFLHLYHSTRYSVNELNTLIEECIAEYSWEYRGIVFPPLVVFDTAAANIDIENENDNSEVSKFMTMFKQIHVKYDVPVWIITHLSKSANGKSIDEISTQSARGASAWKDNSNWDALLSVDTDQTHRIFGMGKVRHELEFRELKFSSTVYQEIVLDVFGEDVIMKYRYSTIIQSSSIERQLMKAEIVIERKNQTLERIKQNILDTMIKLGPASKRDILGSSKGNTDLKKRVFKELEETDQVVLTAKNRWCVSP
jgi:hypothetical protein